MQQAEGDVLGEDVIVPALAVSSLILGFNLTADGLREMSVRD